MIVKGKVEPKNRFWIQGVDVPPIKDSAVRCLSKWYDKILKDSRNIKRFKQQVNNGLMKIENFSPWEL